MLVPLAISNILQLPIPSPYITICIGFLAHYIVSGQAPAGTLIGRLHHFGVSPTRAMLGPAIGRPMAGSRIAQGRDGLADTLHFHFIPRAIGYAIP